jgi:hypothetical protein
MLLSYPWRVGILQGLNLKNPKTCLLASEFPRLTGETLTTAVIVALEQRLALEVVPRITPNYTTDTSAAGHLSA